VIGLNNPLSSRNLSTRKAQCKPGLSGARGNPATVTDKRPSREEMKKQQGMQQERRY